MAEDNPQATALCAPGAAAETATDAQLLRRFAAERDEEAFAALVERHGPLVLGVCRRVLGIVQDAEDAFQATFLVLARKAGTLREPHLLGNWLYGVAARVARKARASVQKRQMHEKQLHLLPSFRASPAVEPSDVGAVLDEELSRLPEKYRAALVLCYLQGKTNEEAARLLQWPTGTVKGRLARARELLRSRLARRGLQASALLLAVSLIEARAEAGVPSSLAAATVRAGVGYAAAGSASSAPSPRALSLAEYLLRSARRARLVGLALALAFLALGGTGLALGGPGWLTAREPSPPAAGAACHSGGTATEPAATVPQR